jgi:hypothetical protein
VAPVAPCGPDCWKLRTAGWLVVTFSLLSIKTTAPPVPVITKPLFKEGVLSHLIMLLVTSIVTKSGLAGVATELTATVPV